MTKFEVKSEQDVEAQQKDVKLISYKTSSDCNCRNAKFTSINLPTELDNRLAGYDTSKKLNKHDNVPNDPEKASPMSCCQWLQERADSCFKKKLLYKRLPILDWLPKYRKDYIVSDLVAGLTVGLTVIPQAIAYANVAGLPLQYGLYSAFMACFVYTIVGSCKDVPVGPTAISAILTRETLANNNLSPDFAVLLTFVSGCVSLIMGVLQLGFLIDFISGPVSVGFTSAAAIIIATTQVKDVLGLHITGGKFVQAWQNVFEHIGETRLWDTVLGVICMIILFSLRKIKDLPYLTDCPSTAGAARKFLVKAVWLLSTARNIIVVVTCAIMCWQLELRLGSSPVILTGHVKQGLPDFAPPPFTINFNNQTYGFMDSISALGSGCIVVPLLAVLETVAICKVFSDGKAIDATQEMLAIGTCNVVSSFVSSMPVTGALSRGAVNHSSGVKTTFGGVYTGILVLVSLQFLTPYLYYIPKASLAAVIIAAVVFMVELHVIKPMWRTKKIDLVPAGATFLCCLFMRLELGIVIGISINLLFLLYASARPTLQVVKKVTPSGCDYLTITPDRSLVFPSVEYVRAVISKHGTRQGTAVPVVIDSTHIQAADFTAAKGIKSLIEDFDKRGQPLIFFNLKPSVITIFKGVKPSGLRCCFSEAELNDYLKELSSNSANGVNKH